MICLYNEITGNMAYTFPVMDKLLTRFWSGDHGYWLIISRLNSTPDHWYVQFYKQHHFYDLQIRLHPMMCPQVSSKWT
jgi:hypothetical protein